jgi:hypothetical protein
VRESVPSKVIRSSEPDPLSETLYQPYQEKPGSSYPPREVPNTSLGDPSSPACAMKSLALSTFRPTIQEPEIEKLELWRVGFSPWISSDRGARWELVDKWTPVKQPLSYDFRLTVGSGGRGSGEKAFNGSPTLLSLSPTGTACPPMRYAPMIELE